MTVEAQVATRRARSWAAWLGIVCLLSLVPATWLAYVGWLWLPGPDGRSALSATALMAGPLPLAFGALFAWRVSRGKSEPGLVAGACCALLAIPVYAIAWAWGGRMLL